MATSSTATLMAKRTFIFRGANWALKDSNRSPESSISALPWILQPPQVAGSKTMMATWGFSLRLARVLGDAISANATCSSSSTRSEPLGEVFGFPFLLAVATKAGWTVVMILLASSDNLAVAHLLS
jgi:hypothetical protein